MQIFLFLEFTSGSYERNIVVVYWLVADYEKWLEPVYNYGPPQSSTGIIYDDMPNISRSIREAGREQEVTNIVPAIQR